MTVTRLMTIVIATDVIPVMDTIRVNGYDTIYVMLADTIAVNGE